MRATQLTVAQLLGLPLSNVQVITRFAGRSSGSKAMAWPHVTLAALTAHALGRPVRPRHGGNAGIVAGRGGDSG